MGAWQAWLDLLDRLRKRDAKRKETTQDAHSWRVPYGKDEYNADMKGWKGQGMIEYAMILVLVAIVVIVCVALIAPVFKKTEPPTPPAMNAPLLDIVRWCEPRARDAYHVKEWQYSALKKRSEEVTVTRYKDSPEKFTACMNGYEWTVTR
jgi:hypothetical protein